MEDLSNGLFLKLILMFFTWIECFPKRLWFFSSIKILNFYFYSIFRKTADSNRADRKNVPTNFKQDGPF